jgi:hypothetical protein
MGIATAELLLVTWLKLKTLQGLKASSCWYISNSIASSLQYFTIIVYSVLELGVVSSRAKKCITRPPKVSNNVHLHIYIGGFSETHGSPMKL